MTKQELAQKRITSAGIDRLVTQGADGRVVNALCIPDSRDMELVNQGTHHIQGCGYTAVLLTVRNDGTPESIRKALELMAASLATMQ